MLGAMLAVSLYTKHFVNIKSYEGVLKSFNMNEVREI